jgi:hypothetical protein
MELDAPVATPAKPSGPAITLITLGGSHRGLARAGWALERASIPYRSLGPVQLGSKRILFAVPTRCVEQIKAMQIGATTASRQWEHLAAETEETYFAR